MLTKKKQKVNYSIMEAKNFIQLHIDFLNNLDVTDYNIYILKDGKPKIIKEKGTPFKENLKKILFKFKTEQKNKVLVEKSDVWKLFENFSMNVPTVSADSNEAEEVIDRIFSLTETMHDALSHQPDKKSFKIAADANRLIAKFIEHNPSVIELTVHSLKKDITTVIHTRNVQLLVSNFAYFLGFNDLKLRVIVNGAFFHDVGKIKIPDNILKKQGKLNNEEFKIMKNHPIYGYELLKKNNLGQYATMALNHHEFLDGTGYPNAKEGSSIGYQARIIQICDIFEALTGLRPYREPMPVFKALDLLKKNFVDIGKINTKLFEEFLHFLKMNKK